MITFLRELLFHDFWLKLFSLSLAVLIWLTVSFAIKKEGSPLTVLASQAQERTFLDLPVIKTSAAQDVRTIKISPTHVEVTLQGDPRTVRGLQGKDIRVTVDLTDVEATHDLQKRLEVSMPAGISLVHVSPQQVQVIIPASQ